MKGSEMEGPLDNYDFEFKFASPQDVARIIDYAVDNINGKKNYICLLSLFRGLNNLF